MPRIVWITTVMGLLWTLGAGCEQKPEPAAGGVETATPVGPAPAASDPQRTGVTADTILIGQWGPQTGPAALWGSVARGTDAYFQMINAAGGIHGRKLKLLIRDDSYVPSKTKAAAMELADKEGVFAFVGGVGTATGMAVKDYLAEKKIPWIGPASGSSKWATDGNRYLFSLYPTYSTEAKALVRYLVDTAGKKKIAFLYQNDDFGKEGLEAARAELTAKGLSLVAEVSTEIADQDLGSHILKLKQAEPDAVILFVLPKQGAIALGTAAKLGFRPQWASASVLSDAPLMHQITQGLWDGVIFNCILALPDSDNPRMPEYKKAYETYALAANPKEQFGVFFLAGFLFAEPLVEALRQVGPDLTREKLVDALEKLDKWNGGIGHDITFGPKERQGQKAVLIAKCEGGKAVQVSDWISAE